jgi:hypothetical protein
VKGSPGASRAILTYNVLRLALFGACYGLGWLAGIPTFPLIVAALVASGVLSWFVLRRQRIAMGEAVERTVSVSRARIAERTAVEDAYVDAHVAGDQTGPQRPAPTPGDLPAP